MTELQRYIVRATNRVIKLVYYGAVKHIYKRTHPRFYRSIKRADFNVKSCITRKYSITRKYCITQKYSITRKSCITRKYSITRKFRGAAHDDNNFSTESKTVRNDYPDRISQFARIRFSYHHAGYKRDERKVKLYRKQHGKYALLYQSGSKYDL